MTLNEAIKHCEEVAEINERICGTELRVVLPDIYYRKDEAKKCAEEHHQLAKWLKELKVFKSRKGQWLRMSDLSEQEDDRYECSYCGNVVHRRNKMDLYTFNTWCGRCGSDNGRKIEVDL